MEKFFYTMIFIFITLKIEKTTFDVSVLEFKTETKMENTDQ